MEVTCCHLLFVVVVCSKTNKKPRSHLGVFDRDVLRCGAVGGVFAGMRFSQSGRRVETRRPWSVPDVVLAPFRTSNYTTGSLMGHNDWKHCTIRFHTPAHAPALRRHTECVSSGHIDMLQRIQRGVSLVFSSSDLQWAHRGRVPLSTGLRRRISHVSGVSSTCAPMDVLFQQLVLIPQPLHRLWDKQGSGSTVAPRRCNKSGLGGRRRKRVNAGTEGLEARE